LTRLEALPAKQLLGLIEGMAIQRFTAVNAL
jgi:hypothetical protein